MKVIRNEEEEQIIWGAFRNGSEQAFFYFYDSYFKSLYSYGTQFSKDTSFIKDCIHDLFVQLWDKREKLNEVQAPKAYLFTSLRHRIVKELSSKRNSFFKNEIPEDYNFEATLDFEKDLIESVTSTEIQEKLLAAFNNLPKRTKEAIFLRFYEKLEYDEIAAIMALSEVKYARTLVYRGLAELRELIGSKAKVNLIAILVNFMALHEHC
ncbi:RNA polymerase sigma factor [Adhaeribacter aquaticus]|uniref:RNA polymerase sigma factor n=1 Tax=Adhaeribacter aquaticus TaxID=299567 RepID=UPI000417A43F|nr:sigma-70 family RNA polymerase sigma factor [Adhaeribacter aquaticus]